ncbi:MAG: hypothetical protein FJ318_03630 [SAR202 cluster bacterium]|nr:hypothetical protein [SAR202 cluster bacterium]
MGLVHGWVRLYTAGLPAELRDARREEVAADLWDQASDWRGVEGLGASIWARWLLGIPDDVTWRWAHSRTGHARRKEGAMALARDHRTMTIVVAAVAGAFILGLIALQVVSEIEYRRQVDFAFTPDWRPLFAVMGPVIVGAIVAGFRFMRRAPALGAILVAAGSIAVGIMFYWMSVPLLLALGLSWYAFRRARRMQAGR